MISALRAHANRWTATGRSSEGFTLVELLVVVVIIGVLAGIATPVFLNQRERAIDTASRSDLTTAMRFLTQGVAIGGTPAASTRISLPTTNEASSWGKPGFYYSTDAALLKICVDDGTQKMLSAQMGVVTAGVCGPNGT